MENQIEENLISTTLRSLYRFSVFSKDLAFPSCLLETEKQILKQKLLKLNLTQIKKIAFLWQEYVKKTIIQESINDVQDLLDFKNYLGSVN